MKKLVYITLVLLGLSVPLKSHSDQKAAVNYTTQIEFLKKDSVLIENHTLDSSYFLAKSELLKRIENLKAFSEFHAQKEAYDSAFYYLLEHENLKDALLTDEGATLFSEIEKKEHAKAIKEKLKEIKQQKEKEANEVLTFILSFVLGTGVFVIILLVLKKRNKESKEINEHLERKNRLIEKKNNEILDSILYAKKIQDAMLTSRTYIENIFKEHLILYNPKDIISGDFYWAYNHERSKTLYWATVDCTGHGVPGALMSMIGTVLLNESVIIKKETNPDKILTQMNKYLKRYINKTDSLYQTQDGMDISFCKLNSDNLTLETAGASQSIYILRNRELKELKGDKITLGQDPLGREIKEFSVKTYPLKPNDLIYTFTDGFTDQIGGPQRKKFKIGALKSLLVEISHLPMEKQKEHLQNTLRQWKGGTPQLDDILIMGVKV